MKKTLAMLTTCLLPLSTPLAETNTPLNDVLNQQHQCSPTIQIRSQDLTAQQLSDACKLLSKQEAQFHRFFKTESNPVNDDNNNSMRANVYADRNSYVTHVTNHFDVPSDNGGMYLEGLPHKQDNHAEFVAYEKNGKIWNLAHEYVHYLDGRFNLYGDFCASLHDSHSAPEYCPKPSPAYPHLVWWSEGIAEYISKGDKHPNAFNAAKTNEYKLSELFNTSYENNGGSKRIYHWGYLATRFMMEKHRTDVEKMLELTREGKYKDYQSLVKSWGTKFDAEFTTWLKQF
ncbi:collagenase [Parashewanella spongiae]|nr:collagenase [Parashewanella spongiae]MCL1079150.1 collagenase [Parashewanella spongiae]